MSEEREQNEQPAESGPECGGAPSTQADDAPAGGRNDAGPEPPIGWGGQQGRGDAPEPPVHWEPPSQQEENRPAKAGPPEQVPFLQSIQLLSSIGPEEAREFGDARKMVTAAQITALISLLFGGVLLSTVSIVIAIVGYRKLSAIAERHPGEQALQGMIRRPGALALLMAVLALLLNAISLYAVYPMIMEALQQGDLSSLIQSSPSGTGATPQGPSVESPWG